MPGLRWCRFRRHVTARSRRDCHRQEWPLLGTELALARGESPPVARLEPGRQRPASGDLLARPERPALEQYAELPFAAERAGWRTTQERRSGLAKSPAPRAQ